MGRGLTGSGLTGSGLTGPRALSGALERWGPGARRDLPWRRTRDPWAVLVSEVMLQQTQASRVVPRFGAWIDRWPTPPDLAAAPIGEVIGAWSGLGYNRRAVSLHRCAVVVTDRHSGVVPDDLAALLALPGVGAYTARAVLAFAYERPVGVVDVNAARVLARVAGRPLGMAEAQRMADALVRPGAAWAHNQAMLDLGATICTARSPGCQSCPVAPVCRWRGAGRPGTTPDPGVGSAGTGRRQSAFPGSDREGRGRLVAAMRDGPVRRRDLAATAGWPDDDARATRVAASLVSDGLAMNTAEGGLVYPLRERLSRDR